MSARTATSVACANIAFIKYWGNRDDALRLPANGSISMNLGGLEARTQVTFNPTISCDIFILNGTPQSGLPLDRVSNFLDHIRRLARRTLFARVESQNNFPTGAGIASSAAAFAALSLAGSSAIGLDLNQAQLSRLARLGSGSACRSVPGGFVEWQQGLVDEGSYAVSIAPPEYWDLVDCVAVVQSGHKPVGSSEGHRLANTSPLQAARVAGAPQRLDLCRSAILNRDFDALAEVVELDSNLMHAVMMTSTPPLFYWEPASVNIMKTVRNWRAKGKPVCYTLDAGANVHVLTDTNTRGWLVPELQSLPEVNAVLVAPPGGPAHLV